MPSSVLTGGEIAAYAESFKGKVRYVFGGFLPSRGWDCSGMVGYVLGHHFGFKLPGGFTWSGRVHPPVAASYKVWSGASNVPRSQCEAGDLCCWMTHIGIAIDNKRMISALGTQFGTIVSAIDSSGPPGEHLTIRRINKLAAGSGVSVKSGALPAGCMLGLIGMPYFMVKGVWLRWSHRRGG